MDTEQLLNEAEYHLNNYWLRQITPSGISIILQMIRKLNSMIIVLLFIENNLYCKRAYL